MTSTSRKHGQHGRRPRTRQQNVVSGLETLENRMLLSATSVELAGLASDAVPQPVAVAVAVVTSAPTPDTANGPTARVVNGQPTTGFPAVGLVNNQCTGTLISPTHVLTAGHCVVGVPDSSASFDVNGQTYRTTTTVVHPQYNDNQFWVGYDIAIMQLDRPVAGVTPIDILRQSPQIGTMLTLVGFGEGGTNTNPVRDFGNKRVGQTPIDQITQNHIIWRFDNSSESNTAPGDSGGPAFVTLNGTLYVAGVTSGGDNDSHVIGGESFDTRVDTLATWIDGIIGNVIPNPNPEADPDSDLDPNPNPNPEPSDDHSDNVSDGAASIVIDSQGSGTGFGDLEIAGDNDVFQVNVPAAGSVTISVTSVDGTLDTVLTVLNERGDVIAENDDIDLARGNYNSEVTTSLQPGTYFISVGAYADAGQGGYRISVDFSASTPLPDPNPDPVPSPDPDPIPDPSPHDDHVNTIGSNATPIELDRTGFGFVDATIDTNSDRDVFRLDLAHSGTVYVDLFSWYGDVDTRVEVHGSNGLIASNNGRTDSSLALNLRAGTYYIVAASARASSAGEYGLDVFVDSFWFDDFSRSAVTHAGVVRRARAGDSPSALRNDIDGDGQVSPLSDGVLAVRYLAGFTGEALINGAANSVGKRTASGEIEAYLASMAAMILDVNGDGRMSALDEGIDYLRYLAGFTDESIGSRLDNVVGDNLWVKRIGTRDTSTSDAPLIVARSSEREIAQHTIDPPIAHTAALVFEDQQEQEEDLFAYHDSDALNAELLDEVIGDIDWWSGAIGL